MDIHIHPSIFFFEKYKKKIFFGKKIFFNINFFIFEKIDFFTFGKNHLFFVF